MIKIIKTDSKKSLLDDYYKNINTPLDDMWENAIIPSADFYTTSDNQELGYFAVDSNNYSSTVLYQGRLQTPI